MCKQTKKNPKAIGYFEVMHSRFHVRKDHNPNSESLGKPFCGDKLILIDVFGCNGWHKVLFNGTVGWISCQAGKAVEVKMTFVKVKADKKAHVRTAPGSKAKSLGIVEGGTKLVDQAVSQDGYRLVIFDNQNGWISEKYIEKE